MSINLDFLNQQLNQLKALGEQNHKLNTKKTIINNYLKTTK